MFYVNARFLTQPLTGVQRYGIEISLQLKKIFGEQIRFVAPKNIIHKEIAKKLEVEVVGTHVGHLWEQFDLYLYMKKKGDLLLLCLGNTAPIWYKNKIVTLHDITFIRYPKTFSSKFLFFYKTMIPIIVKTAKHVFTVSEFSKSEIVDFYKIEKNKCSVAYNAVSSFFSQDNQLHEREVFFLTVSSVKENKNTILPLKVFKELNEEGYDIPLYVIGDLKSSSFQIFDLSEYENISNIKFIGRVSDETLRDYYRRARAFIFPSLYEGFGIPPLEAQACGCLVLSSDRSCLPEVLGDSVIYFDPLSEKELKSRILEVSKDSTCYSQYIEIGKENVRRYSWLDSALKYKKIINSFL